jgi:L-threonylcarbamoyladenylate synthase
MCATILSANQESIAHAVKLWKEGDLVAFPTETVYGLGADASNESAVAKIFEAKQRPSNHPLILHLAPSDDLSRWVADVPGVARTLIDAFWPGPLTIVLQRSSQVSDFVTGGQDTVGLRCPSHPVAQALLSAFGGAIAAPSANKFGKISPTAAAHVFDELGPLIPLIIDGGESEVGIESTIVDLSYAYPVLLRPGQITTSAIERVLDMVLARPELDSPRVSGSLKEHYAPCTALQLVPTDALEDTITMYQSMGIKLAVISWSIDLKESNTIYFRLYNSPSAVAHDLYRVMREADQSGAHRILVEQPNGNELWEGVADRLKRAAFVTNSD